MQLLVGYKADFAKHSGTVNAAHILSVFDSVSIQLSKSYDEEVRKFTFTGVIPIRKGLIEYAVHLLGFINLDLL